MATTPEIRETRELPRYLQLLWDRASQGRRGPKPGRRIEDIGRAAAEIADRNGLAAVSMKSVAQAVGFTTMSLYRYLDSKEELQAVMLDVAYGQPDSGLSGSPEWRGQITAWARGLADRRRAHPWMLEVRQPAPPLTPNVLAWTEAGLAALATAPLTSQQRLSAMLAIDGWGQNHVRQSLQMGLVGHVDPDSPQGAYTQYIAELVDAERFPRLTAAAPEALDDDGDFFDEEFDFGLRLLLDGIEALIARRA
jgi:AcrR family transcriptional regulator